jgi:hypothetical protein
MTPSSETAILIFNFENTPQPTTGAIPLGGMFPEGKTKKTKEIKEMEKKTGQTTLQETCQVINPCLSLDTV